MPRLLKAIAATVAATLLLIAATCEVNVTPSEPQGLYLTRPGQTIERGDLVSFCLGAANPYAALARERRYLGRGTCPVTGLRPLLKTVAGLPGDVVEVGAGGIYVNGQLLPQSRRPSRDSHGRSMPPSLLKSGVIPTGQALVMSLARLGFDSRHFGLVPLGSLTKARPWLVFNPKEVMDESEGE